MNTQLKDLYRQVGDAVEPAGDVTQVLARAHRRRVRTQVATPIAGAAVVAGAVGLGVTTPWSDTGSAGSGSEVEFAAALPEPASVAGKTYTLDQDASRGLPKGVDVEIDFHQGAYSASAGCNTFSGDYDMSDDVLVSSPMGATMGFCPGLGKADAWMESFLGSGPKVAVDGDRLTLDNGKSEVALSAERVADKPLEGTNWKLDSIVDGDVVSSAPHGAKATLSYESDELTMSTGCAERTAGVDVTDGSMTVTGDEAASSATKACADPKLDRAVREVLAGPIGYDIEGTQLRIQTEDGALIYTAN